MINFGLYRKPTKDFDTFQIELTFQFDVINALKISENCNYFLKLFVCKLESQHFGTTIWNKILGYHPLVSLKDYPDLNLITN